MAEDGLGNDSPLRNPNYFLGPLRTLKKSLSVQRDLSVHDIADAYALLCSRVRECGEALYSVGPAALPNYQALETLKQFKQPLLDAVKRDIRVQNDSSDVHTEDLATLRHAALSFLSDLCKLRKLSSILSGA